ncbi:hypothetical protein D3C74_418820 [compost metagenome]
MWLASPAHEVRDRDAFWSDRVLRQQAKDLGQGLGLHSVDVSAIEQHLACLGMQQPGHRAQQGGFSAGVGADDAGDPARRNAKFQAVDDGAFAVSDPQAGNGQFTRWH